MKFTVEKADFVKALSHLQSVVEKKNTIPVLSNVRVEAQEASLKLDASDMEIEISETISAQISDMGGTTIPVHTLYEVIRKIPDGAEITLEEKDSGSVIITSGKSKFTLGTLPIDKFPLMSDIEEGSASFVMNTMALSRLINQTSFTMSTDDSRYFLNGIYFHKATRDEQDVLRTVSTDGHRLSRVDTALPEGAENIPGVIIARKTVNELSRLLQNAPEEVKISITETRIMFEIGSLVLKSRLVDGTFPEYDKIAPKQVECKLNVDVKTLFETVDRVAAISEDRTKKSVKFTHTDGLFTVSMNSRDSREAKEDIDVSWQGEDMEIGFNVRYILEFLSHLEGDNVEIGILNNTSLATISEPGDDSLLFLIMPMRV